MGKVLVSGKKLTAAEKQRRYREKRKLDLSREEEYQEKHKARNAKRKKVHELTEREHRREKKKWRQRQNASRKKKKIDNANRELTPPSTPEPSPSNSNGNKVRGRKVILRHRSKCVRENKRLQAHVKILEEKIRNEQRKAEKYKKRLQRQNAKQNNKLNMMPDSDLTPNSKTRKMLTDLDNDLSESNIRRRKSLLMNSSVARTLTFHNAMTSSIKENYMGAKSKIVKRHISSALSSKLILRYRFQTMIGRTLGLSCCQRLLQKRQLKDNKRRFLIESFFLSEDVSRTTAGIKETVTRKKIKKQKRYLLSDMKTLFKKFIKLHGRGISYTTFTRFRPFYVLKPTEVTRNTCLCKQHTNIELKAAKLRQMNLIDEKDPHKLYPLTVCDKSNCQCMYNMCQICKTLTVPLKDFEGNNEVKWEKWVTAKEIRQKKKNGEVVSVPVQITSKVTVDGTLSQLTKEFHEEITLLKKHAFNIKIQNKGYDDVKTNLKRNEAILHADFSENYSCKLASEVQSFHFGGSRNQVTLHTGIMYTSTEKPLPFATVSPNKEHGPAAIWAHLKPVLEYLKIEHPDVSTVHFFSDGPSSQYKQKQNFYLFTTQVYELGFQNATWSFFESSHGKGAPDGVGGALKRMANHYVAHGCDITDATVFFNLMKEKSKIKLFYVTDNDIEQSFENLPSIPLKTIAGTRGIHQVITYKKNEMIFRPLSCFCDANKWEEGLTCKCYFPAESVSFTEKQKKCKQRKKSRYEAIYSSSESDSEAEISLVESDDDILTMEDFANHMQRESVDQEVLLEAPTEANISEGTFIIVELLGGLRKKTKLKFAGLVTRKCNREDDGDYIVTFLVKQGTDDCYLLNEKDVSAIDFAQVNAVLPQPEIVMRGSERFAYKFPCCLENYF
ncbi:uncharacterized protein LOC111052160 isoform X2 [Nilaparvata lugens]|uniref:uncharacterized protein LOC111052160 isoform X2 n=1 Tax=Nilaparvata lugens TaxID=108931 RepID=UPI00193E664E|nr:uncharacterized protein LOC111052160 isoform X2 [Nilaparvata lugens]